jgi:kynureninase
MTASPTPIVPDGVIYLDGNSLGPPSARTRERVRQLLRRSGGAT